MAGIDTSIYQNALRPVKSVQDYDNEYMQGQQNKLALSLGQQKADEYTRGVDRGNRLREMLGGFSPGMAASEQGDALTRGGFLDEARKVIESGSKVTTEKRAAEKAAFETARDQLGFINQIISSAKDPASYVQGRQMMAARGMDVSQIPEQYDPAYVQNAAAQTMTELQRLEEGWKKKKFDLETDQFGEVKRHNRSAEGVAAGNLAVSQGNLGLSRQRLAFDQAQPKGVITQTDQGPMLVDPRTGQAQPVMAGGKPVQTAKAPTEFQGKSAAFGARAEQAASILDQIGDKYSPAAINAKQAVGNAWLVGGALEAATNKMALSENDQKAEQAQRDFVNAVLRQESGAAIGASEFDNAKKQYFPQPGDGQAIKAQKKRNRDLAVQGLINNAGRAEFHAPPSGVPAAAAQHSPEIESLLQKYGQ